jgi:signal transduction histidine kinase
MRDRARHLHALDVAVPLLVAAVITVSEVVHGAGRPLAVAAGLGAAGSLFARRRAPGWTLAVSGGLALAAVHIDRAAAPGVVLAPAVALYSLALTRGRTEQLVAGAAAVGAVVAAEALRTGGLTVPETLGHVLLVAIPLLAAEAHRTHRANIALLRERLELAERTREQEAERRAEQERVRIARDLHDVVAHTLTTINVQAATGAELADRQPERAKRALEGIADASRDAIGELRSILGVLREDDDEEAPTAPAPGVDGLADLVESSREAGLEVRLELAGDPPARLPDAVSLAAFRIVQESLTNASRHAAGAPVRVEVAFGEGSLALEVLSGAGERIDRREAPGVGILGMRERASAVGGTLRAGAVAGGFKVDAELPYAAT